MKKIQFTCKKCGKVIQVQESIYKTTYADQEYCLSCRQGAKQEDNHEDTKEHQ